ncbi:MAG TPA: S8 family serine peptidase [Terriglobia bacterium]|nr:S8 family serine peptidase [Terriglobia bacterium]
MKKVLLAVVLLVSSQLSAWAGDKAVVADLQSGSKVQAAVSALGAKVLRNIPGTSLYLLKVPVVPGSQSYPSLGITSVELDSAVTLRPSPISWGILKIQGSQLAEWYAQQPALKLIQADKAVAIARGRGIVVADLNARVDVGHKALIGHLTAGYDFVAEREISDAVLNQSSASFLDQSSAAFLDQSSAAFLDQSSAAFLDQSSAAFLDQSSASFLDQSSASFLDAGNPAHGHGTLCAALIAAVAPDSMIMPLRVFDDKGNADLFSIVKAIHYAVTNGADVINMSFGLESQSPAVKKAIAFAIEQGVTVVASAGNNDSRVKQYPAAYNDVLAAAATDLQDKKASFSNYGDAVFVTAPGVNIISAYPGGYYAVASGTSFSAPLVAGEAALLRSNSRRHAASRAIAKGAVDIDAKNPKYDGKLGAGRIDILNSLQIVN